MKYTTIAPHPDLAEYVRFFWVLECEVSPGNYYVHRSTADACTELIFHYRGRFDEVLKNGRCQKSFISGIHGQCNNVRRFKINQNFGIFGVYLYPFAMPALFGLASSEVAGQMIDLYNLGKDSQALEEKIILAKSTSQRVRILSQYLMKKLKRSTHCPNQNLPIKTIIDRKGQVNIKQLADQCYVSKRQLERKFKALAGYSPKHYARIVRFQSVFEQLKLNQHSLTEVAYLCGYADQAHFIHDFKEFSGFRPKEFINTDSTETKIWTD